MAGKSGEVPNFGHNDGSFLLPLSACAYRDYRPTLQAGERTFAGRSSLPPGRWDELSHWLGLTGVADGGRNAAAGAPRAKGSDPGEPLTPGGTGVPSPSYPEAGLYLLKGGETWGLLRCVDFRSRPAHSDQLHLDIWWKGLNIARDPGTFRYAADSPWDNGLSAARVHNTVLVGGQDPMERAGRFLWLGWSEGRLLNRWRSTAGELEALIAQHNGYRRWDVVHRRSVLRWSGGVWVVVDDVLGEGSWPLQLTWSLPDWPFQVEGDRVAFDTPQGGIHVELSGESLQLGVYRQGELQWGAPVGNGGSRFGWWSPTYSELEPSLTLLLHGQGDLPKRMVTRWELEGDGLRSLEVKWHRLGENELPWARVRGREEQLHFEIAGGGG